MTKEDLIWFAGLFDGESCISIYWAKRGPDSGQWLFKISLGMAHKPTIDKVHHLFPGSRYQRKKKGNYRAMWMMEWTTKKAAILLREIYPYLVTKKKEAKVALSVVEPRYKRGGMLMTDLERESYKNASERLKVLKREEFNG